MHIIFAGGGGQGWGMNPKRALREKYWGERNLKRYTCDGGGVCFPLCFITLNIFCL